MNDITTNNITATRNCGPGELVYECDDGVSKSEIKVRVAAKSLPGAVVWVPQCCFCDANGETDLGIAPHEVAFVLGESDADPATVFETMMAEQAKRAHRAKRQMDGLKSLGLPAVPVAVHSQEAPRATAAVVIEDGGGNDVLDNG